MCHDSLDLKTLEVKLYTFELRTSGTAHWSASAIVSWTAGAFPFDLHILAHGNNPGLAVVIFLILTSFQYAGEFRLSVICKGLWVSAASNTEECRLSKRQVSGRSLIRKSVLHCPKSAEYTYSADHSIQEGEREREREREREKEKEREREKEGERKRGRGGGQAVLQHSPTSLLYCTMSEAQSDLNVL